VIDEEGGKALLEMQSWECGDDFCHLPLLIVGLQIRTVDIGTGAQGDQHGFRPGTTREGKSTSCNTTPCQMTLAWRRQTILQRKVFRSIRPIGLERLGGTREGGSKPRSCSAAAAKASSASKLSHCCRRRARRTGRCACND